MCGCCCPPGSDLFPVALVQTVQFEFPNGTLRVTGILELRGDVSAGVACCVWLCR